MRACAENGGVIGINGIGPFLSEGDASAQTIVRHIDYAVQLVGPGHVGIGLDYVFDREELAEYLRTMRETFPDDSTYSRPTTMVPPEALSEITQGLCDLGYDDDAVLKILGGNWRRIAQSVWRT